MANVPKQIKKVSRLIPAVEAVLRSSLKMCPGVTDAECLAAICAVRKVVDGNAPATRERAPVDRLMQPSEVAELLGKTTRTVRRLANLGAFVRRYSPDAKRKPLGYTEQSVRDFMAGKRTRAA